MSFINWLSEIWPKGGQQWIQLHRLLKQDVAVILGTVRAEFGFVQVYFVGSQGIVIASQHNPQPNQTILDRINHEPRLTLILKSFGGTVDPVIRMQLRWTGTA